MDEFLPGLLEQTQTPSKNRVDPIVNIKTNIKVWPFNPRTLKGEGFDGGFGGTGHFAVQSKQEQAGSSG